MKAAVYFNEIEPFCAQWLRNQFGDVDERDICDIPEPAVALRQHYFAGLGGWEWALRLAGWPADYEVWTGSCPCQPFSVAGKGQAHEDERDLWPAFFHLIAIGRPPVIVGEQVNGAITYGWLDRVCDDLEGIGYAIGAAVLPACGVGAPHIRQRLYWCAIRLADRERDGAERTGRAQLVAHAEGADGGLVHAKNIGAWCDESEARERLATDSEIWSAGQDRGGRGFGGLGNTDRPGREARDPVDVRAEPRSQQFAQPSLFDWLELTALERREQGWSEPERRSAESRRDVSGLGDTDRSRLEGHRRDVADGDQSRRLNPQSNGSSWAASISIYCQDGRYRRIPLEPGFQPLADSGRFGNPRIDRNLSSRIGALQAAGNAIVIPLAAEFIRAVMDVLMPVSVNDMRHGEDDPSYRRSAS